MRWLYITLLFIAHISVYLGSMFQQNKYTITMDRAVVNYVNKNYLQADIKTFRYNRTTTSFNGTIMLNQDAKNVKVALIGHKLYGNEYKKTAVQSEFNLCTLFRMNFGGIAIAKTTRGNFTNCPLKEGKYIFYNFYFDGSKFPPNLPEGEWKFVTKLTLNNVWVMGLDFYVTIKYPLES